MKKILIFNTLYTPYKVGGAEVSVQSLAESLAASADYSVTVVTLSEGGLSARENIKGVDIIRLRLWNIYWPFMRKRRGRWSRHLWHLIDIVNIPMSIKAYLIIRRVSPDIVHTNNLSGFSCGVWLAAKLLRTPVVHTIRDYYLLARNSTLYKAGKQQNPSKFTSLLFSFPKRALSNLVSAPVAISCFVANYHARYGYFANKLQVVANGVARPSALVATGSSRSIKGELTFGYIGRLDESKGVGLLLEAFSRLVGHKSMRLVIAGATTPWFETEMERYKNISAISVVGWAMFSDFIEQVDIVVVPSLWNEPFGRVVIEANSYGKPVITSDKGALPELVCADSGATFQSADVTELMKAMLKLEKDIKSKKYNYEKIAGHAERYGVEECLESYKSVYKSLLSS